MKTPADFCVFPWASVTGNSESETIAKNIMTILSRTGNVFRPLTWDEYKVERLKDGNFTESEKKYFDKVIKFCFSPETARLFCQDWNIIYCI